MLPLFTCVVGQIWLSLKGCLIKKIKNKNSSDRGGDQISKVEKKCKLATFSVNERVFPVDSNL